MNGGGREGFFSFVFSFLRETGRSEMISFEILFLYTIKLPLLFSRSKLRVKRFVTEERARFWKSELSGGCRNHHKCSFHTVISLCAHRVFSFHSSSLWLIHPMPLLSLSHLMLFSWGAGGGGSLSMLSPPCPPIICYILVPGSLLLCVPPN